MILDCSAEQGEAALARRKPQPRACSSATTRARWARACSIAASQGTYRVSVVAQPPAAEANARPGGASPSPPGLSLCAPATAPKSRFETRRRRRSDDGPRLAFEEPPERHADRRQFRAEGRSTCRRSATGMVRVSNRWLSVDPYMRGRMNDVKSYVPPFQLDEPMEGGAVGEVVESKADGFAPGDLVLHMARLARRSGRSRRAPQQAARPRRASRSSSSAILGVTGATAYFGLLDAASAKEGDIVFVSAAAGAVGSAVVQIAKAKGMTVIGSAGGTGQMRLRPLARRRPGRRLSRRADPQGPGRSGAGGHRRLFRQCRRRPSRRRAGARPQQRAASPSAG